MKQTRSTLYPGAIATLVHVEGAILWWDVEVCTVRAEAIGHVGERWEWRGGGGWLYWTFYDHFSAHSLLAKLGRWGGWWGWGWLDIINHQMGDFFETHVFLICIIGNEYTGLDKNSALGLRGYMCQQQINDDGWCTWVKPCVFGPACIWLCEAGYSNIWDTLVSCYLPLQSAAAVKLVGRNRFLLI